MAKAQVPFHRLLALTVHGELPLVESRLNAMRPEKTPVLKNWEAAALA